MSRNMLNNQTKSVFGSIHDAIVGRANAFSQSFAPERHESKRMKYLREENENSLGVGGPHFLEVNPEGERHV